ncbi:MAG: HDOD domain-containing protein [Proteobacteria bacterium]|nr:HDOD domain-containing protein [Pseudomonadota bacterium]
MLPISQESAEKILGNIRIPPRPSILVDLMAERNKSDPNLTTIAHIVSRDVVLSAAMLKTVNSPFFGLRRKIDSIEQAVMAMGSNNVFNILTGLVMRNMNDGKSAQLNRFWDTAENTAFIAALIARRIPDFSRDIAYTVGLFHDCGIPLMMARFPDYMETLKLASTSADKTFTEVEDERHSTNHATIGYLLAKNWNLSESISLTILHHHNLEIFSSRENLPAEVCGLIAVIQIAEALSDITHMREDASWLTNGPMLLDYVGISDNEFSDITEEIMQNRNG